MSNHYGWKIGQPLPVLGAHSLAKHSVFADYTRRYIHILSPLLQQPALKLTIVDGFCGGGVYNFGSDTVPGSPLILLKAVEAAEAELSAIRRNGFNVHCDFFFVDRNADHIAFLHEELGKLGYSERIGRNIHLVNSHFEAAMTGITSSIKEKSRSNRSLFFLDQYGWSDVSFSAVRKIFADLQNPEVILTFSVDTLINYLTDQTARMKAGQRIELDPQLGEALTDLRSGHRQRAVIQGFLYRHIIEKTGAAFYTPFFIRSSESRRSYWLLHLSKHARARDEMARRHWDLSNTFVHPGRSGFNALGYDPSIDTRQLSLEFDFGLDARSASVNAAIEQLPRMISESSASDGGAVSVADLFQAHCNETPLTMGMVSEALVRLRDDFHELEVFGKDQIARPRARVLRPDDQVRIRKQTNFLRSFGRPAQR